MTRSPYTISYLSSSLPSSVLILAGTSRSETSIAAIQSRCIWTCTGGKLDTINNIIRHMQFNAQDDASLQHCTACKFSFLCVCGRFVAPRDVSARILMRSGSTCSKPQRGVSFPLTTSRQHRQESVHCNLVIHCSRSPTNKRFPIIHSDDRRQLELTATPPSRSDRVRSRRGSYACKRTNMSTSDSCYFGPHDPLLPLHFGVGMGRRDGASRGTTFRR